MRIEPQRHRSGRQPHLESLEPRQVMSADPLGGAIEPPTDAELLADEIAIGHHTLSEPDFWLDPRDLEDIEQNLDSIEQLLSSAHNLTGWNQVRTDFGFRGGGQTVAVIDSGVAYDHWALGGGFGTGFRVVGGWDFTEENDANPYDDGPEGSHGTHVAGIIGNSSSTNSGVAPDVDLVALRVFNDAGQGYFSWMERALQWVYTNRNAFANPITAINLSIGTSWNSASIPSWAMLEDEFLALKNAGIFIAVSAGNSFSNYNEPGLSYPAASSYVVPVMSVDDSGSMSTYSQRHTRAIGAPGRFITSTVPDYAGNHNGTTDDFAGKSGTSMAAPYVAGASVLIRQAMQFVGYTNITQDTIYDHMMATADTFWDAATQTNYKRLNLGNAIDALIPNDEYGSTVATAYNMGAIGANAQFSGMFNTLSDADYFRFTAGTTGTISFAADLSHGQTASWLTTGLNGWTSGPGGQTYNFDAVAGQTYTLGISASGLANYTLQITTESSVGFVDWGTITHKQVNNVSQSDENWYRVQASQAGYLTAEAFYSGSSVSIDWFNAAMQQVATGSSIAGGKRVEVTAAAGQQYFLRVNGTSPDIDFRLTNLVSLSGATVTVGGTTANDTFTFTAGSTQHTATVNGVAYQFNKSAVNALNFSGAAGSDTIALTGSAGSDIATIQVGSAQLTGSGYTATASGVENILLFGGGGNDSATFYGSNGDDLYKVWSDRAQMQGGGYLHEAHSFSSTVAYALGGTDRALLYDTAGHETYTAWSDRAQMAGSGFTHEARGFDRTLAYSTGGNDWAIFVGTAGNDIYSAWRGNNAVMYGTGYFNDTQGFGKTTAYGAGGADQAFLYDSAGDDRLHAWAQRALMTGPGFSNDALDFAQTFAFASTGSDRADLYDTATNDAYTAWADRVRMTGSGYANEATGFDRTKGHATTGADTATFHDTAGDDLYVGWADRALMQGEGYFNDSVGFKSTFGLASAGADRAVFYDSPGDDNYIAWSDRALMTGAGFSNDGRGFDRTYAKSESGADLATFVDTAGNDTFSAWWDHAVMYGSGYYNDSVGFKQTLAHATAGDDQAFLNDSPGDDTYTAWWNRAYLVGNNFSIDARGFDRTFARATTGNDTATFHDSLGNDVYSAWSDHAVLYGAGFFNDSFGFKATTAVATGGIDQAFLYDSAADDSVHALAWGAYLTDSGTYNSEARGFDRIEARRSVGNDRAFLSAVDYAFELIGGWGV